MEPLKHECGVAMIRLRRPLHYYKEKYGSYSYALDKLYLLMEKQHNRGQEAAGVGVVKLHAPAGYELIFRERELGKDAIPQIFARIGSLPVLTHCRPKRLRHTPPSWAKYTWDT